MSARRVVYSVLAALAFTALVAARFPAPTAACSGTRLAGSPDPPADLVFTGTTVRLDDPAAGPIISSGRMLEWTFAVDDVTEGKVGTRVTVASEASSSSCGFEFQLGKRYLVRAVNTDTLPVVGMGSGTHQVEPLSPRPTVEGTFRPPFAMLYDLLYGPYLFLVVLVAFVVWVFLRQIAERRRPQQ